MLVKDLVKNSKILNYLSGGYKHIFNDNNIYECDVVAKIDIPHIPPTYYLFIKSHCIALNYSLNNNSEWIIGTLPFISSLEELQRYYTRDTKMSQYFIVFTDDLEF